MSATLIGSPAPFPRANPGTVLVRRPRFVAAVAVEVVTGSLLTIGLFVAVRASSRDRPTIVRKGGY
jgi:hypothetical protein